MTYALHIIIVIGIMLPTILGYNLVFGKGKILHFGPVGVSVVAIYAFVLTLMHTESFLLALLAGLAGALLISLLFAWMALRLEPDGLGILTIAMHLSLLAVVLNWTDLTRGALGITRIPKFPGLDSVPVFAAVTVIIAILCVLFMTHLHRSRLGRALSALAEHRNYAESLGISRPTVYISVFCIAGVLTLMSNVLFVEYFGILHPNDYVLSMLIFYLMCVVAGKPGSVGGVVLAATLLTILKEGLRFVPLPYDLIGPLRLVLFGVILIVAVYVRRKELFPVQRTV